MGHHIHAFLFRGPIDRAAAAALGDPICLCELPQGVIAMPVSLDQVTALEEHPAPPVSIPPGFIHLDNQTWAIGHAVARGGRFAYVETDYFGGIGDQQAAAWDGGVMIESSTASINAALAVLGVEDEGAVDRFEAIGLDVMRDDDNFADGFDARAFAIHGRRLIGRYASAAGFLDVRGESPALGRWDGALHRWQLRPDRQWAEGARAYAIDFERTGTPGLRSDGVAWRYNDGPNLVHDRPSPEWSARLGRYQLDGGERELRLDKGHLYLDDVRLLRHDDGFEATTGERVSFDGHVILVGDRRGRRA